MTTRTPAAFGAAGGGTRLASEMRVRISSTPAGYTCHWDYIPGPMLNGRAVRTLMWICEYPYRTVRATGPCDDCTCPARPRPERVTTSQSA